MLRVSRSGRRLKAVFESYAGPYPATVAGPKGGDGPLSPTGITVAVVLVKAVLDAVFEMAAAVLTDMERHPSYSAYRCLHRVGNGPEACMCTVQRGCWDKWWICGEAVADENKIRKRGHCGSEPESLE